MLSSLSSFRLFDPDDGLEEALRFDSGAERIVGGEAKKGVIAGEVTSSPGVRDVDEEGDAPTGEFSVNGAPATISA